MQLLDRLRKSASSAYESVNRALGGVPDIIKETIKRYGEKDAPKWAASLAYYTFFALFPFILTLVGLTTYIFNLSNDQASQQAVQAITQALPIGRQMVTDNLDAVVEQRGTITLIGLVGLIWSASGGFATLSHTINETFEMSEPRGFVKQRLVALVMMLALIILLLLSVFSSSILGLLPDSVFGLQLGFLTQPLGRLITQVLPIAITVLMFIALYRWVPTEHVNWKAVLWGAGIAAVGWELAKRLFAWYVGSGLSNYGLVYGSLGSVVILLFWIYISASIVLFGAHLAAVLDPEVHLEEGEDGGEGQEPG